jgi:phage terminase small subunit
MKDFNGKQAAIRTGYSPRTAEVRASTLLSYTKIKELINQLKLERVKSLKLTPEYVLTSLRNVAERTQDGKLDSSGANRSLELLGKHLQLFTDVIQVGVTDDLANKLMKARQRATKATQLP